MVQAVLMVVGGILLVLILGILSDVLYWDRYLRAYTFNTFVENPFPTVERLYPQETVPGAQTPITFSHAEAAFRTISSTTLDEAVAFAEASDSTSLIVSHRGVIQLERYWQGKGADQVVYSFSMHKSIVALLLGIAIDEGHIAGIDDPLTKYLPDWRDDPRERITLRHALQMNSGLEPMSFPVNPFSKHVKRQIGTDLARTALSFRLHDEPGSVFSYNGVNPTLMVMVLERATGQRYAAYLSGKLWRPLGNEDASCLAGSPGRTGAGRYLIVCKADGLVTHRTPVAQQGPGERQANHPGRLAGRDDHTLTDQSPLRPAYLDWRLITWNSVPWKPSRVLPRLRKRRLTRGTSFISTAWGDNGYT